MNRDYVDSIADVPVAHSPSPRGPQLPGYAQFFFSVDGIGHPVYYTGRRQDPPLLLLCELAGFAPGLLQFADRLVAAGFQVYIPWLFGPFARRASLRNALRLCISREFGYLRAGVSAPVTRWLRALAQYISHCNSECRVGAIGMCLTGAFAISLVIEPAVSAAVAAQPSVPMSPFYACFGFGQGNWMQQLNVSERDIDQARTRLNAGAAHLFGCRFVADRICPAAKLERLKAEFPVGLQTQEYGSAELRNSLGARPHASFTKEYRLAQPVPESHPAQLACMDLIRFFRQHL